MINKETLKLGSKGNDVKSLQQRLNITVDGTFGPKTEEAVKRFQKSENLIADGIVGQNTWNALYKHPECIDECVLYQPIYTHITRLSNRKIKYLVIHYTAGSKSTGGSALATRNVFINRPASADFIVDDNDIVQINPNLDNYYCWAVGDIKKSSRNGGKLSGLASNKNAISIEICSTCNPRTSTSVAYPNHKGWKFTDKSLANAIKIAKIIMKKYNIPISNVIRHYDVTGKQCPGIIGWNDEPIYDLVTCKTTSENSTSEEWLKFKQKLI